MFQSPFDDFEFGVAGGYSFTWWLQKNESPESRFFGFDTFEGLPEKWGGFEKGSMAYAMESLNITDSRASLYKGLFQDTLIPFLEKYDNQNRMQANVFADKGGKLVWADFAQTFKACNFWFVP